MIYLSKVDKGEDRLVYSLAISFTSKEVVALTDWLQTNHSMETLGNERLVKDALSWVSGEGQKEGVLMEVNFLRELVWAAEFIVAKDSPEPLIKRPKKKKKKVIKK